MSSAGAIMDNDDVLALADTALGRLSQPLFEAANQSVARLQSAAQGVSTESDRDVAVDNILDALSDVEARLRPIGQSVAGRIAIGSKSLVLEREAQIKVKHALVLNAVEMHLASLIMAVKRKMICGKMPVAANLLANLTALRSQLPAASDLGDNVVAITSASEENESPKEKAIQSWTERLARRFMGR